MFIKTFSKISKTFFSSSSQRFLAGFCWDSSAQVPRILADPFSGHSEDGVVQDTRMPRAAQRGMEGISPPPGPRNPRSSWEVLIIQANSSRGKSLHEKTCCDGNEVAKKNDCQKNNGQCDWFT